jgi:hypothetical protein
MGMRDFVPSCKLSAGITGATIIRNLPEAAAHLRHASDFTPGGR